MTRQAYGETFPGYARSNRAPLLMKPGRQQAYLRRKSGYESCLLIAPLASAAERDHVGDWSRSRHEAGIAEMAILIHKRRARVAGISNLQRPFCQRLGEFARTVEDHFRERTQCSPPESEDVDRLARRGEVDGQFFDRRILVGCADCRRGDNSKEGTSRC